jgi:cytochrome P450
MQPSRLGSGARLPPIGRPADVQDFLSDPVGCMVRVHRAHGPCAAFARGDGLVTFVFGPLYNREVLTRLTDFHIVSRFPGPRHSAQRRFGRGLFSMNGTEHQFFRRLLMPPFRKESLLGYHSRLLPMIEEQVRDWQPGQQRDVVHEAKELTLRITTQLIFGLDALDIGWAIEGLFERWLDLNHVVSFAAQLPVEAPPGCYQELLAVAEQLEQELQRLVECKRRRGGGEDLLGLMLQATAAGHMTDLDVIGQTITLFNAAYHTTSYALTWALFLLAQHPAALSRLDEEMDGALAGEAPALDRLERMAWLDSAVKESLRLLPPVVFLPRITPHAIDLGPYHLPPHTIVLASPYVSHHLAEVFPAPERFDPQRWLCGPARPWAYIPFGGGSRMCLGAPLATLVVKLALCQLLRRFRFQVVPGACIERHGTLSLGARYGVPVLLHPPDRRYAVSPVTGNIHAMVDLPGAGTWPARPGDVPVVRAA